WGWNERLASVSTEISRVLRLTQHRPLLAGRACPGAFDRLIGTLDLAGLLQGRGKGMHCRKAVLRVFGEGTHHHLLYSDWDAGDLLLYLCWRHMQMLPKHLQRRSREGQGSTQPLIDHDPKCVLVGGRTWFALDLLRGHVGHSPRRSL